MLILANNIRSLPIVSMRDGQVLAVISDLIIERKNLAIVAFWCNQDKKAVRLLMGRDVRCVAKDCVLVDSPEALSDPKDIVRFPGLLKASYNPLNKQVVTTSGQKLGKVDDYAIDLDAGRIQKLYTKPNTLKSWLGPSVIIDRSQILDLTAFRIIVQDTLDYVSNAASLKASTMSS